MTCTLMKEQSTYDLPLYISPEELQVHDDSPEVEKQKLGVFTSPAKNHACPALDEQMPEGPIPQ